MEVSVGKNCGRNWHPLETRSRELSARERIWLLSCRTRLTKWRETWGADAVHGAKDFRALLTEDADEPENVMTRVEVDGQNPLHEILKRKMKEHGCELRVRQGGKVLFPVVIRDDFASCMS
jgi:hypothetical protein